MSHQQTRRPRRHARGITLVEVMGTMGILLMGVMAAMTVVQQTRQSNRQTLTALQAQLIAEQALENVTAMGCTVNPPCGNIAALDNRRYTLWQTASGEVQDTEPPEGSGARAYEVALDVDSGVIPGSLEGGAAGAPAVNRNLAGAAGTAGNVANVRVSVSWQEPERRGRQVVVMQTRVSP
ncbi:type IV pilus modification PilV family protein [Pyxidicoccus xibeiensis]|uniref:type IV pilus modification PilV family protein n=1 Tax=Pyxidicoccus xibeiensis TaxID=2906759 RepID=UPI0020A7193F|nr:pilus assembly protein [Pyxidicoccus xibeiensis]MCP3136540.1 pilus assembly protein [Pyxidicoccus xibeiensis]